MHFTFRLLIVLDKLIFLLDYIFRLFISLLDILVNDIYFFESRWKSVGATV